MTAIINNDFVVMSALRVYYSHWKSYQDIFNERRLLSLTKTNDIVNQVFQEEIQEVSGGGSFFTKKQWLQTLLIPIHTEDDYDDDSNDDEYRTPAETLLDNVKRLSDGLLKPFGMDSTD